MSQKIRVAILDLYAGEANEGMRGIRQSVHGFMGQHQLEFDYDIFDVRLKAEVPDLSYDIYISTGGPGDPIETAGSEWEQKYFDWVEDVRTHNHVHPDDKKHILLICHSFQIYCRQYRYGKVSKRRSTSFGVMTVHKTAESAFEPLFKDLNDPFWVVDSRDYQITKPNLRKINKHGSLLCIEKYRPHVLLERAVMGIRFDDAIVGFQFHPEADAEGIRRYLLRDDKKKFVIKKYGKEKYQNMIEHLEDPDKIARTYGTVIPRFLKMGLQIKMNRVAV